MGKPRILIADDEEGIRESLSLILSDHYDIAFAVDGQEALSKITTGQFALILMDIKMPKLDGLEVMKRMQQQRIVTPVLVLTAYQSVELAKEAVKLGAIDYLPKPFEREQIFNAIQDILAKR